MNKQKLGLWFGPVVFFFINYCITSDGLQPAAQAVLATTLWVGVWWITEPVPIAITALLPIILFPVTSALKVSETTAAYGNPLIFLFIGGFMIATAIERWNLHKRIALSIIQLMGRSADRLILGFMLATALLSMWISNTATSLMMLPIALAISGQLESRAEHAGSRFKFSKALMLAIAYSASIGGMATLIGTPTNVIFSGIVKKIYGYDLGFARWMTFGLPISITLLFICWIYLTRFAFKMKGLQLGEGRDEISRQLTALGKISKEERLVLMVFSATAFLWITRSFLLTNFIPGLNDTVIAIAGACSLFLIPSSKKGEMLLNWEQAAKLPWGLVLLFGGGLALASGFKESGLAEWVGSQLNLLDQLPYILLLLVVIASVNFLTEVTSNVATASMILPILAALTAEIGVHPFGLMVGAVVAASCAFMLPVATPPNAVVFGSGCLEMQDMVRTGIWLNFISIVLLTLLVYFLLPVSWGINLFEFPDILAK